MQNHLAHDGVSVPVTGLLTRVERWETDYLEILSDRNMRGDPGLALLWRLDRSFQKFSRGLQGLLEGREAVRYPRLRKLLAQYAQEAERLHRENREWLAVYLCFCPSAPAVVSWRFRYLGRKWRDDLRVFAEETLNRWTRDPGAWGREPARIQDILHWKGACEVVGRGSPAWGKARRQWSEGMRGHLSAILKRNKAALRRLFRTFFYDEVLKSFRDGPASDLRSRLLSAFDLPDEARGPDTVTSAVRNLVCGYWHPREGTAQSLSSATDRVLGEELLHWGLRQKSRTFLKILLVVMAGVCVALSAAAFSWDEHLSGWWRSWASGWSAAQAGPGELSEKEQFLRQEILDAPLEYPPSLVREHTRRFVAEGHAQARNGYLLFAENILKGFLLNLANREADGALIAEVLNASQSLSTDLRGRLEEIVKLYARDTMKESVLRERLLDLRRIFVPRNVYPFFFMTVRGESPYILLYAEPIHARLSLKKRHFERLDIDPRLSAHWEKMPTQALFVRGQKYPFHNAAGYFEGEYAVVLQELSARPEWTAWHELGHMVEQLRHTYESRSFSANVELNAMLFPALFVPDAKEYVLFHILPFLQRKDKDDYYAQAAKGIVNGFLLLSRSPGRPDPDELISNHFEDDRISAAKTILESKFSSELRAMALTMYKNPRKYLGTAGKGRYKGVVTNAEEIILGADISPDREVVSIPDPDGGPAGGPRLIRDGEGDDEGGPFNVQAFFTAILVFLGFEISMVLIHRLGGPIRERKMHGLSWKYLLPPAAGNINRRKLERLVGLFMKDGWHLDPKTRQELELFRLTATAAELMTLNTLLLYAPAAPRASNITNEAHQLLFYIPFVGPYVARSSWLWPAQRVFNERDRFNAGLASLAAAALRGLSSERWKALAEEALKTWKKGGPRVPGSEEILDDLEKTVESSLDSSVRRKKKTRDLLSRHNRLFMNHVQARVDFDRVDKYMPGDDVRDIDWNATARSADRDLLVRKRPPQGETEISFVLDMGGLDDEDTRRVWAEEMVKSLKVLGRGKTLDYLIFLMPDGRSFSAGLHWRHLTGLRNLFIKIFREIREHYPRGGALGGWMAAVELGFYADEENQDYLRRQRLVRAARDEREEAVLLGPVQGQNLVLVGVPPERRKALYHAVGRRNRLFFWQGGLLSRMAETHTIR
ncbi:MAG: DUF58 domain-containing protein [Candidatus Omnitrophota bacterium]|nr:DUF58 domain-containing protein [Candidatus Omnitrophota bacterium]MDZ4243003.1 DUF58 domain-containing protein [Candidatus Omnitrophota bacterium]